jgi:hypothetical protein
MPDVFTSIRHNLDLIISLAARHRVPAIYPYRFMIGALSLPLRNSRIVKSALTNFRARPALSAAGQWGARYERGP